MTGNAGSKRSKRRRSLRRVLLTGLVIVLPVVTTLWVIRFVLGGIDGAIAPIIRRALGLVGQGSLFEYGWVGLVTPVVSIGILIVGLYAVGLVGGNVLGRQIVTAIDNLVLSVPVVGGIYSAVRQFLDTFSSDSKAFSKVVLIQYPREGVWTLGLLTSEVRGEIAESLGKGDGKRVCVFVPTTPNPTGGFLLFVPKSELHELDMSVDDAFKVILSGGVLSPGQASGPRRLPVDDISHTDIKAPSRR